MNLTLIQQPPIVNFSGNPIPYTMAIAPYGVLERTQDIRIKIMVEVEVADGAQTYTEVHEQTYYPDLNGKTAIDIASITGSYLKYYIPRYTLNNITKCTGQSRRFRLKIIIQKDGILLGDPIFSNAINVLKGGMAYESWHQTQFFDVNIAINRQPLHFYTSKEMVGPNEKRYMYWMHPDLLTSALTASVEFHLADGTVLEDSIINPSNSERYKVYCIPTGLADLKKITGIAPADFTDDVVKYIVRIVDVGFVETTTIIAPQTFWVDNRHFYSPAHIVFTNSLGGMDTIRLLGDIDFAAEFTSSQAKVTVPPSGYINSLLQAQDVEADNLRTDKFTGSSDFVSKEKLMHLSDIFNAAHKFEPKGSKFIPVLLNKKTVKFYNSKDSLQALTIEWQHAFSNQFYTPLGTVGDAGVCPPLNHLSVVQLTRNTLQVLWGAPMPYDLIELEIDNGTPAELITLQLSGNSGSQIVFFENPVASGDTGEITVRARLICDFDSVPINYGAYSTVDVDIFGNTPPVASDDVLTLAAGYNTPQLLDGNVLTNDYDPDGDALECVVAAGATDQGGTYSIDAAGAVTYTPPTSLFNGTDFFTYTCREVAEPTSSTTAKCYINVGNITLGTAIYVKITERNHYQHVTTGGMATTQAGGDFYITFWADPAASIPKNLTGLGIVVNVKTENFLSPNASTLNFVSTGFTTQAITATGVEQLFFSGETLFILHAFYVSYYGRKKEFSLLPGTGYIPI